jgi:hypothetical protein
LKTKTAEVNPFVNQGIKKKREEDGIGRVRWGMDESKSK